MEFFAIYAIIATLCLVCAGIALMLIDHYLEMRKIERIAAYTEYMIPEIYDGAKKMSIETIKSINDSLFNQFNKEDEE